MCNPVMGTVVLVRAASAAAAARKGVEVMREYHADESCCSECEMVTISEVEVYPVDDSKREDFDVGVRVQKKRL